MPSPLLGLFFFLLNMKKETSLHYLFERYRFLIKNLSRENLVKGNVMSYFYIYKFGSDKNEFDFFFPPKVKISKSSDELHFTKYTIEVKQYPNKEGYSHWSESITFKIVANALLVEITEENFLEVIEKIITKQYSPVEIDSFEILDNLTIEKISNNCGVVGFTIKNKDKESVYLISDTPSSIPNDYYSIKDVLYDHVNRKYVSVRFYMDVFGIKVCVDKENEVITRYSLNFSRQLTHTEAALLIYKGTKYFTNQQGVIKALFSYTPITEEKNYLQSFMKHGVCYFKSGDDKLVFTFDTFNPKYFVKGVENSIHLSGVDNVTKQDVQLKLYKESFIHSLNGDYNRILRLGVEIEDRVSSLQKLLREMIYPNVT